MHLQLTIDQLLERWYLPLLRPFSSFDGITELLNMPFAPGPFELKTWKSYCIYRYDMAAFVNRRPDYALLV